MNEPIYPGAPTRITAVIGATVSLGPPALTGVTVTVTDPAGLVVVDHEPMGWETTPAELWAYSWTPPLDAGGKTFAVEVDATDAGGGVQPAFGEVYVEPRPALPAVVELGQPAGVVRQSQVYVSPWCDESDLPTGRLEDSNGQPLSDINLGWMIGAATDLLYVLSGRKYRWGRSVITPSRASALRFPSVYPYSSAGAWGGYGGAWGFPVGWAWSLVGPGWAGGQADNELTLQAPVLRVHSVLLDGTTLSPAQYQITDSRKLVLAPGLVFPLTQQVGSPLNQPGTCQIDYEWGRAPRERDSARLACAELAIELALGFSGQDACRLSPRTVSASSEGVSVTTGVSLEFLKEDLTNLPICDLFLRAMNPTKRRRPSVFLSPQSVLNRST